MKRKTILMLIIVISGISLAILGAHIKLDCAVLENVNALSDSEGSSLTCSSSICGRCFEKKTAWPFSKCNWTGRQSDFCDCD